MKKLIRIFFIFGFFSAFSSLLSQNYSIDSLKSASAKAPSDSIKTMVMIDLGNSYYHRGNYSEALSTFMEILKITKKADDKPGVASAYNGIGMVYEALGNYSEAIKALFESLRISEKKADDLKVTATYINIALIYLDLGDYNEARKNCLKSLEFSKKSNNKMYIAYCYNTLGLINYYEGKFPESLQNHFDALKLRQELNDKKEMAASYSNIGISYFAQGNEAGNKDTMALKYSLAQKNYLECLKIMRELNNDQGIAGSYVNLGSLFVQIKNFKAAKSYLDSGITMYKVIGSKESLRECYLSLMQLDTLTGKYKDAYYHYKSYILYNDSLLNQQSTRKITQVQMLFDFEKKTETDSIKNAEHVLQENIKHEEQIKQQRMYTYGGAAGFVFMLVIAIISFRAFKTKQKANLIITEQKLLVEKQKAEVENQKSIIEEQKQKVEEHQKDIIDSITYAKRLQEAILPPEKAIKEHLPNSFVLYQPKDIVAGDFYWFENINEASFIAAADCTGHGVPGAMVSVVCSNALNRAVLEFKLTDPGKILDKTRELVLETFSRSGEDVKDGMDISLAKIEVIKESKKLHPGKIVIPKGQSFSEVAESLVKYKIEWSGANNPLWYFKSGQFLEITAHKQAIGKTDSPTPFTTHTIELGKNDTLYLLTDGYADQFGGPKGKKFKYKQLQEILSANQKENPEKQKEILRLAFQKWKGNLEQIDDVTIIGITI